MSSFYADILKQVMKEKKEKEPGFFSTKNPKALPKENEEFRRNMYGENFELSDKSKREHKEIPEDEPKEKEKVKPKEKESDKPVIAPDGFKEYDFSKKKASFEMKKRIRDLNSASLAEFKSKIENGERLKGFNVDANDLHYEENLINFKKKMLNDLHKEMQVKVSGDSGVATNMKRHLFNNGALDLGVRSDIDSTANNEHRMALLHAKDYLDKNLHYYLAKEMKNNANTELSNSEKKMRDYMVRNNDGTYSINPDGTSNIKFLLSANADSRAADMLNANLNSVGDSKEHEKVMNAATLLAANRPIYVR